MGSSPSPRGRRCPQGADEGTPIRDRPPPEKRAHVKADDPQPAFGHLLPRGEGEERIRQYGSSKSALPEKNPGWLVMTGVIGVGEPDGVGGRPSHGSGTAGTPARSACG